MTRRFALCIYISVGQTHTPKKGLKMETYTDVLLHDATIGRIFSPVDEIKLGEHTVVTLRDENGKEIQKAGWIKEIVDYN